LRASPRPASGGMGSRALGDARTAVKPQGWFRRVACGAYGTTT
jgi:hypothetical protein